MTKLTKEQNREIKMMNLVADLVLKEDKKLFEELAKC